MTDSVGRLLAQFFGSGNELDPTTLAASSPELAAWLNDRVNDLRAEPTGAHLLPRRWRGKTTWYALAHSRRQARALAQELQAFVGASYAEVDRAQPLNPDDTVEAAVLDFTGGNGFSFDVVASSQAAVRSALDLLASLRRSRPLRADDAPKPLGRLLRDFEMAVVVGDEQLSASMLEAIEQSGLLTTQNVLFLRVRRLAALDRHQELLSMPELGPLLSIRRPARVTADLMAAVYRTELGEFEARNDASGALAHFGTNVLRRFPALFRSRQGIVTPETVKAFAVQLVASGPYEQTSLSTLLDSPDLSPRDREWIAELGRHGAPSGRPDDLMAAAIEAVHQGRFDDGLRAALASAPGRNQAELILRCAVEIDSLEALRSAYDAVCSLDDVDRIAIEQSRWLGLAWRHVRDSSLEAKDGDGAADPAVQGWAELFECTSAGTLVHPAAVADRGVVEWSVEALSAEELSRISGAIAAASAETLPRVSDALPYLLQFLERAEDQRPHHALLEDITLMLLSEGTLRVADIHVLVGLLTTLLELGMGADRYATLVGDFLALWGRTEAPSHLDAALEYLDALVAAPAPDPDARMLLLQAMLASFQRWRRRVRPDQWLLLEDLADELGISNATATLRPAAESNDNDESPVVEHALNGRTVAIYTLTESAAQRAAAFLARHFTNVRVEVAHDHVASDRLRSLAGSADLFVVATRSAKHAATTFIQANRSTALPTLFPSGKGSASIIRSIYSHLATAT